MKSHRTMVFILLWLCPLFSFSEIKPFSVIKPPETDYWFYTFSFSSDLSRIAVSSYNRNGESRVSIWDIPSGKKLLDFSAPLEGGFTKPVISPNGKWIVTLEKNAIINIRDIRNGMIVKTWTQPSGILRPYPKPFFLTSEISPDSSQILISTYTNQFYLWTWETNQTQAVMEGGFYYVQFSRDGKNVLLVDNQMNTLYVSIKDLKTIFQFEGVNSVLSSDRPAIHFMKTYTSPNSFGDTHYSIHSVSIETGQPLFDGRKTQFPISSGIHRISPRGFFMAVLDSQFKRDPFRIPLWDWKKSIKIENLVFSSSKLPYTCEFSPDGRYFAANQGDAISIFDVSSLASGVENEEAYERKKVGDPLNKKAKGGK